MANLENVAHAVDFLEKALSSKDTVHKLDATKHHDEVIRLASENGFKIDRESLAEAMKIVVDRSLAKEGIPSWVRARVHAPVHD